MIERLKSLVQGRILSLSFLLFGFLCGIIVLVVYCLTGTNDFVTQLSPLVIAFLAVGAILCLPPLFLRNERFFLFLPFLCYLFAFFEFIVVQVNYIANVLVSIDGNTFSASFILTIVFFLLAILSGIVSFSLFRERKTVTEANGK